MIDKRDLKNGDVLWGCAFDIDFDRQTHFGGMVIHTKCEPVKGMIENGYFYVLKRNGDPRANGVSTYARKFAWTYKESVEVYNKEIEDKISKLENVIDNLKTQLIEL